MQIFLFFMVAFIGEAHLHAIVPDFENNGLVLNCGKRVALHSPEGLGDYPWLVKLLYKFPKISRCGGVLIAEEWVLSSAACLRNDQLQAVMVGKYDTSDDWDCIAVEMDSITQRVLIGEYTIHDEYGVGLLNLNNGVRTNEYVNPICVPFKGEFIGGGMVGRVAGWSHLDKHLQLYNDQLKSSNMMVMNITDCEEILNITLLPYLFCAEPTTRQKPCVAMPGGPFMMYRNYNGTPRFSVAGIMLEEAEECDTTKPFVFVDIRYLQAWISKILRTPSYGGKINSKKYKVDT